MRTSKLALFGLVLLVGCGGGGGGGGSSSGGGGTPLTLKVNDLTTTLNENDAVNIGFEINKSNADYTLTIQKTGQSGSYNLTEVEPGITWSIVGEKLNIEAQNLDKMTRTVTATLTASLGGEESKATFEMQLNNGSLDAVISSVDVYVNDAQNIVSLSEVNDISQAYGKVLELLDHTIPTYSSTFDSVLYLSNLSEVNTALVDIANGGSENLLNSPLAQLEAQLNDHANEYLAFINGMAALENSLMSLPSLSINVKDTKHSFFVGNSNYGGYDVSNYWRFNDDHQFVGNLINPLYGNCSI